MNGTIHIFGYGETQLITAGINFKTLSTELSTVQAVIDDVKANKPAEKTAANHHVIHIFSETKADFRAILEEGVKPKDDPSSFSVEYADLDDTKIDALVAELTALATA